MQPICLKIPEFLPTLASLKPSRLWDIFCVDLDLRLKVIYLLDDLEIHLTIQPEDRIPSLFHWYSNANWLERECFDLSGVYFDGHPHLKRLILYPEFAGHPLRKNYPINKAQPLIPTYV